jgi:hypothetical protein
MAKSWLVIGMLTAAPLLSISALARGDHGPYTRTFSRVSDHGHAVDCHPSRLAIVASNF